MYDVKVGSAETEAPAAEQGGLTMEGVVRSAWQLGGALREDSMFSQDQNDE